MEELQRLATRIKYAQFFASDNSTDNYYHLIMTNGNAQVCSKTGHVLMYCRGHEEYESCPVWRGGDVQPEHDRIVDNWLYNNYHAYRLLNGLLDQVENDNNVTI